MEKPDDTITGFHVFVYGTLRTNQPESQMFKRYLISSKPARIQGQLYQLPEGYPILKINPEQVVAHATADPMLDWTEALKSDKPLSNPRIENQNWIEGELLTLQLNLDSFNHMDTWEGFSVEKDSFYQRVITQASDDNGKKTLCWCYACLETPQAPVRPINSTRWERPDSL